MYKRSYHEQVERLLERKPRLTSDQVAVGIAIAGKSSRYGATLEQIMEESDVSDEARIKQALEGLKKKGVVREGQDARKRPRYFLIDV